MKRLIIAVLLCVAAGVLGCERRVIRREELFFTKYAEKNWDKLTPEMKAEYTHMVERQKARAREKK